MPDELMPYNDSGKCDGCGCPVDRTEFYCDGCIDREDLFGLVGGFNA